jgi:hypothetical protein
LAPGTNPAPFTFTFSPSPTDAVAWADPSGNPNANDTRAQLEGQCHHGTVSIDDPLYVNEGVKATALHSIRDILNGSGAVAPTVWNTEMYGPMPEQGCIGGTNAPQDRTSSSAKGGNGNGNGGGGGGSSCSASNSDVSGSSYGNVLEGPIFLVDAGDDCGAVSFTHTKDVTGIAWGVVYDVQASGGTKFVSILIDVSSPHLSWGEAADADATDPTNILVPSDPEMLAW